MDVGTAWWITVPSPRAISGTKDGTNSFELDLVGEAILDPLVGGSQPDHEELHVWKGLRVFIGYGGPATRSRELQGVLLD